MVLTLRHYVTSVCKRVSKTEKKPVKISVFRAQSETFQIRSRFLFYPSTATFCGDRGGTVVKVLCYKSEGRWFDPSWCHWNFSLT